MVSHCFLFPIHLALYLQYLGNSTGLRTTVEEAVYALTWIHQVTGLPSPADDYFVQALLGELRCMLALPTVKNNQSLVSC